MYEHTWCVIGKREKNMCMNRMYYVYFFGRKFIAWGNIGKVAYEKSFFTIAWVECKYRANYSFSYSVLMKLAVYRIQHENKVTLHGAAWSSFSNYDLVFLSFKKVHITIIWLERNGNGTYCWICLPIQSQYDDVVWILVYARYQINLISYFIWYPICDCVNDFICTKHVTTFKEKHLLKVKQIFEHLIGSKIIGNSTCDCYTF